MLYNIPPRAEKTFTYPYLTNKEFKTITKIKNSNPNESFKNLQYKIKSQIPRLNDMDITIIKSLYEARKSVLSFTDDPEDFIQSEKGLKELIQMAISPEVYLRDHVYPFSFKKKKLSLD